MEARFSAWSIFFSFGSKEEREEKKKKEKKEDEQSRAIEKSL